ncbi:SPFH domain-containing protein [Streptomyces sp. NPDC014864]|uniref:SPFH domain-containing protein n=1 Tax=Streptomyces sp. NPDC014864 TaxID=3364924 RepID=UPI0036FA15D6
MRTTATSPTPDPSESGGQPGPVDGQGGRPARLIRTEVTTEIPVHLLFRDEAAPAPAPPGSAVVALRPGTGEPSRLRHRSAGAVRVVPEVEAGLEERAARVLPGAAGVAAGVVGTAGCALASWWAGVLPLLVAGVPLPDISGAGPGLSQWAACAGAGALGLAGFAGLARGRAGRAWVLGLFGRYRGTVRRTGLLWVNPLVSRRRVDVRLRHWRSEPMSAADPDGLALRVAVLVVWRVRDTARAVLGVDDHETYLRACVEVALARVPVEPPGAGRGPAEAAEGALTRLVARETAPVGLEVFSVRAARVEWAPEAAGAVREGRRETGP